VVAEASCLRHGHRKLRAVPQKSLAIDVVTLYVARSEMQRAADAAALAAARTFVDSGVTSDPTNTTRQTSATTMATATINSIIQQNKVGGVQPNLVGTPTPDFSRNGSPQITVTLQRTDLPMFFARIWGSRSMTVTASATAEAYNASSSQNSTGSYVPIQPKCVKPLLLANSHNLPAGSVQFIDPNTGAATPGLIGQPLTFVISPACTHTPPPACVLPLSPPTDSFVPALITNPNPNNLCPSCQGASDYEQSIECCDFNPYSCGANTTNSKVKVDVMIARHTMRTETNNGVSCLITQSGPQPDTINVSDLQAGTGPAQITAQSGPLVGNLVTTSPSIATLPVIDAGPTKPISTQDVAVIGFVQLFIEGTNPPDSFHGTILNVIGCGNNASASPVVSSGSTLPIPVRLIHP
jgi:Putative Flp pilus-assembly TadE/G-like